MGGGGGGGGGVMFYGSVCVLVRFLRGVMLHGNIRV